MARTSSARTCGGGLLAEVPGNALGSTLGAPCLRVAADHRGGGQRRWRWRERGVRRPQGWWRETRAMATLRLPSLAATLFRVGWGQLVDFFLKQGSNILT